MFERLRKALGKISSSGQDAASSRYGPVSEWAASQGISFFSEEEGQSLRMQGKTLGRPWRLEVGKPTRKFIQGAELRAKAELAVDETAAVLIINRPLKEVLDKEAYQMFTDPLQTTAGPNLPEELRWLAMYKEIGWDKLPMPFWQGYSVLSDRRETPIAWIDAALAQRLLQWPQGYSPAVPFVLMLQRGNLYLRMQYTPGDATTLQYAADLFTHACEAALARVGNLAI